MKFTLANVFNGAFSAAGKGFVPLLVVTLLLYLLPNQLMVWGLHFGLGVDVGSPQVFQPGVMGIYAGVMLVVYVLLFMQMSAVYEICLLSNANKPVKLGEVLRHSLGNAVPIFVIYLLCALGWMVSGLLLFIPALVFGTIFSVVVPAYVAEKPGIFGAFSRSRALTKGHRWGIFGLWLIVLIIYCVLAAMVEAPILMPVFKASFEAARTGVRAPTPAPSLIGMTIMAVVFSAIWVVMLSINASVYSCLRGEKDGRRDVEKIFE